MELKRRAKSAKTEPERDAADITQNALKIALNAVFGKSGDAFSKLYSPGTLATICLGGQILLLDMVERLVAADVTIIDANTDGIYVKVPRGDERWKTAMDEWKSSCGIPYGVERIESLIVQAMNVRCVVKRSKSGELTYRGTSGLMMLGHHRHNHGRIDAPIVVEAVVKSLLTGEAPERIIRGTNNPAQFQYLLKTSKTNTLTLTDCDGGRLILRPKSVLRCYATKKIHDGSGRFHGYHHSVSTKSDSTKLPERVGLMMTLPDSLPADLDISHYVALARKRLRDYKPEFNPEQLTTDIARRVWDAGLVPGAAIRKMVATGASKKEGALSCELWERYPTIVAYTGPTPGGVAGRPGIVAVDVDNPEKWRAFLGDTDANKLAGEGHLTTYRADDPTAPALGRDRGKLFFILNNPDHRFSQLTAKTLKKLEAAGIEIMYGHTSVACLGEGEGRPYRLCGTLQALPEWLETRLLKLTGPRKPPTPGKSDDDVKPFKEVGENPDVPDFDGIISQLSEIEPRMSDIKRHSIKQLHGEFPDGSIDRRWLAVFRCPGGHSKSGEGDADLRIDPTTGEPFYNCQHATCDLRDSLNLRLWQMRKDRERAAAAVDENEWINRLIDEDIHQPRPEPEPGGSSARAVPVADAIMQANPGRFLFIEAPTGSGKSHGAAEYAGRAIRMGQNVVIVVPTNLAGDQTIANFIRINPDLAERAVFIRQESAAELREAMADPDDVETVVSMGDDGLEDHRMVQSALYVLCHESLGRRGWSRYLRKHWKFIQELAPTLIVDELPLLIRGSEMSIPTALRVLVSPCGDGRVDRDVMTDCPASMEVVEGGLRHCEDCQLYQISGVYQHNRDFKTPELVPPRITQEATLGDEFRPARGVPIRVDLKWFKARPEKFADREDPTSKVAEVLLYKDMSICRERRRAMYRNVYAGNRDEDAKTASGVVLDHIVGHLFAPTIKTHTPVEVTEEGEFIGQGREHILGIDKNGRRSKVTYPVRACDAPRLSGIDLVSLEMLRELMADGCNVVGMSATLGTLDRAVLDEVFENGGWDHVRIPKQSLGLIEAIAVVHTHHEVLNASLLHLQPNWLKLIVPYGKFLIFAPNMRSRNAIEGRWKKLDRGFDYATAKKSGLKYSLDRTVTDLGATTGVLATTRQPIGAAFDGLEISLVMLDFRAIRLMVDLIVPHTDDPDAYLAAQMEELCHAAIQNMGRSARGDAGKRTVVVILNAPRTVAEMLVKSGGFEDRAERVEYQHYADISGQMFHDARTWLEGSPWPDYDPTANLSPKNTKRQEKATAATEKALGKASKRKTSKEVTMSRLMSDAKAWKDAGKDVREFMRKHSIHSKNRSSLPGILKQLEMVFMDDATDRP
jgi:hypothetical protein